MQGAVTQPLASFTSFGALGAWLVSASNWRGVPIEELFGGNNLSAVISFPTRFLSRALPHNLRQFGSGYLIEALNCFEFWQG